MPEFGLRTSRDAVPDRHRVPALFLNPEGREEGEKGMQDKGNASWGLPCVCLHIVFSRDMGRGMRDMLAGNGGIAWVSRPNRETFPRAPACRP